MTDPKPSAQSDNPEQSKVEHAKRRGDNLRGTIHETLADDNAARFEEDDLALLKFHGLYQQDDRDTRADRRRAGLEKDYSFMIRIRVPAGVCTAAQYLDIDDIAHRYGNNSVRLTNRQAFQIHGVIKSDLRRTLREINGALLSSLAACGDVPRNVMAPPVPRTDGPYHEAQAVAARIAREFAPATGAYHEIWVEGERVEPDEPALAREEPFYGSAYLPRKFKIGVGLDSDNSIDAYAYDAALIGIVEDGTIAGYNLLVGGGLGMTHNKPDTYARLATPLGHVAPEHAVDALRAVIAVYRDNGDRADRRHARLKYLIEHWGLDRFRAEVEQVLGRRLGPPRETQRPRQLDHIGRHDQGDGRVFLGVFVPNGRVNDGTDPGVPRYASAFRAIARELSPRVILTPMQSLIFADLSPEQAHRAEQLLAQHNIPRANELSRVRRFSMACPALPTCGLALAEAERAQPALIEEFESEFERLEIADTDITVRMTGCPNGCARPYNADIGVVGRKPGVYHLFVGGGLAGDRLADLYLADVSIDEIVERLRPLLERYATERNPGEPLGDYYRRSIATDRPERAILTGREQPAAELYSVGVPDDR